MAYGFQVVQDLLPELQITQAQACLGMVGNALQDSGEMSPHPVEIQGGKAAGAAARRQGFPLKEIELHGACGRVICPDAA
jgi:hypothetical protein